MIQMSVLLTEKWDSLAPLCTDLCVIPGAPLGHLSLCVVPRSNRVMAAGDAVALAASVSAAASVSGLM